MTSPKEKLRDIKKRMAKERDILRKIHEELESLLDSDGRAVEALDEAVDALSEYV